MKETDSYTLEKTYHSSAFSSSIVAPCSKSYTQRAIALALLSEGETRIVNPAICDDTFAAINMAKGLGATITVDKDLISVKSDFKALSGVLSSGESGLAARMFTPIAALLDKEITITGKGSLLNRPVSMMEEPLISLGVKIKSNNGFLPLRIQGPLTGGAATIDGTVSSQVLTGLLIALPLAKNESVLNVAHLQSIPYIDMTLDIISQFGVKIINSGYKQFYINGNQNYIANKYTIEGDWSNAAFFLVGGAISGSVEITGLNLRSKQADTAILKALQLAGAYIKGSDNSIFVKKSELKRFEFDATHCPDLFPPLVILAAVCQGKSSIKGIHRLAYKESNRAVVLQKELAKIGIRITLKDDIMFVHGGAVAGGEMHSNNDHRIAMAGTIASLVSKNPVTIRQAEAVNKSYPEFYRDFEQLRKS